MTALDVEWEQQWLGDEMLGLNSDVEVKAGDAGAKADIGDSIGLGVSVGSEVDIGGMVDSVCDAAESAWNGLGKGWKTATSWFK